jgi:hypothetical protein
MATAAFLPGFREQSLFLAVGIGQIWLLGIPRRMMRKS